MKHFYEKIRARVLMDSIDMYWALFVWETYTKSRSDETIEEGTWAKLVRGWQWGGEGWINQLIVSDQPSPLVWDGNKRELESLFSVV